MKKYIGTKIIKANPNPMTYGRYCELKGWEAPVEDRQNEIGYMVGYPDANGDFSGKLEDGCDYISWSPRGVFDSAYKPISATTFGSAIEAMKKGCNVCRSGWNGKNMFIYLINGSVIEKQTLRGDAVAALKDVLKPNVVLCPHIDMKAADGSIVIGWLASQTDMLAEDWMIVE